MAPETEAQLARPEDGAGAPATLTIEPAGVQLRCTPGESLLETALSQGFFPKHSCRRGECNACEARVIAGEVAYPAGFIPEGIRPGYCLTCTARPVTDVTLEAPEVSRIPGRRVVQAPARVAEVRRVSADVAIVSLRVQAGTGFSFSPGQYMDVILRDGTRRSYSMANAPDAHGTVEWHVRAMPGGRFSPHVYEKLKPRDVLRLAGPFGAFALQDSDAPVILLASGTGYAPIASFMRSHHAALSRRGAALYWGGRRKEDLYAYEEAAQWAASSERLRFVPVLSEPGGPWGGRTGFVHEAVASDFPDLSRHEVYACGNPLMVDAASHVLTRDNGLSPAGFHSDAFITALRPAR
ncbi:FAD-binding oxidoreductase [Cupriavidus basilensis]|uniref:FAD-binding oxidoreductase n=1 Tax=Cupriavidus basilensis TaxID=68895 RepID=A0ABT6AYI9_9BURK|nr:FAD-binding oxidoreductase [Cupriavidus basilensis]MDF3837327.1 FAD-binding oxidoreductase [Cupriavidus basilensis]